MTTGARVTVAGLLVIAGIGALARAANSTMLGRAGAALAAVALFGLAFGAWRKQTWAFGAAFFIALSWLWAVIALTVQNAMNPGEAMVWIAWSVVVMVTSVRTRPADARQRLHA